MVHLSVETTCYLLGMLLFHTDDIDIATDDTIPFSMHIVFAVLRRVIVCVLRISGNRTLLTTAIHHCDLPFKEAQQCLRDRRLDPMGLIQKCKQSTNRSAIAAMQHLPLFD